MAEKEYIEREALTIENLEKYMTVMEVNTKEYGQQVVVAVDDLMYLLTADVAEVKHGEWVQDEPATVCCSECNYRAMAYNNTPYCPNCGADMRGKDD